MNEQMTIAELMKDREELRKQIGDLLIKFNTQTGLIPVVSINGARMRYLDGSAVYSPMVDIILE
jgi:hypothetical protein